MRLNTDSRWLMIGAPILLGVLTCGGILLGLEAAGEFDDDPAPPAVTRGGPSESQPPPARQPGANDSIFARRTHVDTSPELQRERREFIAKLRRLGLITKVECPADYPRVYVTELFMLLDVDTKKKFLGVILAYYYAGQNIGGLQMLILRDSRTGVQLGTFDGLGILRMN